MASSESKPDLNEEDLNLVCRACLSTTGVLKNMTEWGLEEDFYRLTNIMISSSDPVSHCLCLSCEDMLNKCTSFKQLCTQSDLVLKDVAKRKQSPQADIPHTEEVLQNNIVSYTMEENKLNISVIAPNTELKISFPCPYKCEESFLKKSDLLNHLIKTHQRDKAFSIQQRFYCSVPECIYNINSDRHKHFSNRKILNQHTTKVHKEKLICCNVCNFKFSTNSDYNRHLKTCNFIYLCQICDKKYDTNEKLLVHLMRKHPALHQQYKSDRRNEKLVERTEKRKSESVIESKRMRTEEKVLEYICDSPKRSFATQTLEENIKNDVSLTWQDGAKTDEISTQTVFEDLLSLKSQTSEDSIFCSETVSLSDIQTQTFPLEFGLIRSHKETITSETQSPDLSIKETQTCVCLYEKPNERMSVNSCSMNYISTETQTWDFDGLK